MVLQESDLISKGAIKLIVIYWEDEAAEGSLSAQNGSAVTVGGVSLVSP